MPFVDDMSVTLRWSGNLADGGFCISLSFGGTFAPTGDSFLDWEGIIGSCFRSVGVIMIESNYLFFTSRSRDHGTTGHMCDADRHRLAWILYHDATSRRSSWLRLGNVPLLVIRSNCVKK